ncbi:MAG: CpXC domain-containing protein [Anaerobutyricum soehngenii]
MEGKRLTSYAMEELECPKCGHKHSLKKYKVINVTEKAKLKEEIMKNQGFISLAVKNVSIWHRLHMTVYMWIAEEIL